MIDTTYLTANIEIGFLADRWVLTCGHSAMTLVLATADTREEIARVRDALQTAAARVGKRDEIQTWLKADRFRQVTEAEGRAGPSLRVTIISKAPELAGSHTREVVWHSSADAPNALTRAEQYAALARAIREGEL